MGFQSVLQLGTLKGLIPGMRDHLHETSNGVIDHPEEWRSMVNTKASCLDFPIVFKELLSFAAPDLASQIHQPLEALGSLFGAPIETGRQHRRARLANLRKSEVASSDSDLENFVLPRYLSAGKFLFVIRQVNNSEVARLGAAGFRFASVTQISTALSKTMELPADELTATLGDMQAQTVQELILPAVHMACFILRPRLFQDFDILVPAST